MTHNLYPGIAMGILLWIILAVELAGFPLFPESVDVDPYITLAIFANLFLGATVLRMTHTARRRQLEKRPRLVLGIELFAGYCFVILNFCFLMLFWYVNTNPHTA